MRKTPEIPSNLTMAPRQGSAWRLSMRTLPAKSTTRKTTKTV